MARPEKWKDEYLRIAEHACRLGATDIELADMLGVSARTVYHWRSSKPEFAAALSAGKEEADNRVERSLYERAVGYTYDAVHFSNFKGEVTKTQYREHIPPDTTAMIFWLKNRRPEAWRDKSEVHHKHSAEGMTDNDLERIAAGRSEGAVAAKVDSSKLN